MKKLMFAGLALFALAGEAQAIDCGRGFYAEIQARARAIDADGKRCAPTMTRRGKIKDVKKFCAACGPLAWRLYYLERYLASKKVCLTDRRARAVLAKLRSNRRNFYIIKESCGF